MTHAALLELAAPAPRVLCRVRLPVAPSSNRYWRVFQGVARRSTEAIAYIAEVKAIIGARPVYSGPIAVTVHWYREARRGDLDNRLKVVLDAMQKTAYESDSQIVELHAFRHEDRACPRFEVTIEARGT